MKDEISNTYEAVYEALQAASTAAEAVEAASTSAEAAQSAVLEVICDTDEDLRAAFETDLAEEIRAASEVIYHTDEEIRAAAVACALKEIEATNEAILAVVDAVVDAAKKSSNAVVLTSRLLAAHKVAALNTTTPLTENRE